MGSLNMSRPLYVSPDETLDQKSIQDKKKRNFKEYLVPQLCTIHPFPYGFFSKVMCLPTVLFRLNSLLLAEEIRRDIALEACVGTERLSDNNEWQPFHLETSDKKLIDYLFKIGELKEIPKNEIIPCDIVKDLKNNEITSFEVKVDLKTHTGPSPSFLLQALTSKGAMDEFNLERLEIIGDSFLKLSMSIKLYLEYPNEERKLSVSRSNHIKNANLYEKAKTKKLCEYLFTTGFDCKTWLPPCYVVEDETDEKNLIKKPKKKKNEADAVGKSETPLHQYFTKQVISDKCVADSVEALIGCYLLSSGQLGAAKVMAWLGVNPFLDNDTDFETWPPPPDPIVYEPGQFFYKRLEFLTDGFDRFEEEIGYIFKNKIYILQAFTHSSYSDNDITGSYQRLKFLGDAILEYLITRTFYEDPALHSPGKLTDMRCALVNDIYLASLSVKFNFHNFIKVGKQELSQRINHFIADLRKNEQYKFFELHKFYREETEGLELIEIDVPKALEDVFKTVASAVYLDSGMSLDTVWKVYYPWIRPAMKNLSVHLPIPPIKELYDLVKDRKIFGEPVMRDSLIYIEATLPDGKKYEGAGATKKIAQTLAAKKALADLKKMQEISQVREDR